MNTTVFRNVKEVTLREFIKPFFLCTRVSVEDNDHSKIVYEGEMDNLPEEWLDFHVRDAFLADEALNFALAEL